MESSQLSAANASSGEGRRWFRIARAILLSAFLLFATATYYLWRRYQATRPTTMNQDSGQVHALYAGNWAVYLTRAEQVRLYGLALAAAASLAGTVALDTFVLGKNEND
jgi:dolichyl-phosphate-mannose--protein O-mannosyl transferase